MADTATAWNVRSAGVYGRTDARRNKEKNLAIDNSYHCIDEYAFRNNIKIRRLILDKNISEICKEAFSNCTAMKSIEMPGVRVIGRGAFEGCVRLGGAELTESLEQLGEAAFMGCKRLKNVQINEKSGCKIIPADIFYDCQQLSYIALPVNTKAIHERAFYNCSFTDLKLPQGLERIGDSAFLKCRRLEYVKIPASVRKIEKWAFHGCDRLKVLEFTEDPEYIGDWVVNRSTVIRCRKGSKVDEYCEKFGFKTEYSSEI